MRSTPWGTADFVHKIARGIATVSTPSHGGVMVSKALAEHRLTDAARENAQIYGGYYCFEEDCEWAIAARELPEVQAYFNVTLEEVMDTLYRWNPDYLGIKHAKPSLGVDEGYLGTAWGSWHSSVPEGYTGVRVIDEDGTSRYGIVPRANYVASEMRGEATQAKKVISLVGFDELGETAFDSIS